MAGTNTTDQSSDFRLPAAKGVNFKSKQLTVIVGRGDAACTFYVHEETVCKHSEFFSAALRNGWKEGEEGTVRLPEDKPELFEIFAGFIYFGKVYSCVEGDRSRDDYDVEWVRLASCWILGDKLASSTFKDAIVDAMCDKIHTSPNVPNEIHETIYPGSASATPIRRLLVDVAVFHWHLSTMKSRVMDATWNEFFKDLAVRYCELEKNGGMGTAPFHKPGCKYHEHVAAGTPCYKTMF